MNSVLFDKVKRVLLRKLDSLVGRIAFDLDKTLEAMAQRPFVSPEARPPRPTQ